MKPQPTREQKLAALRGESSEWDCWFPAPDVPTNRWTDDDWITYIGERWLRKETP